MKFRSRFAVVGTLLAVALALLVALPALALDSTTTGRSDNAALTLSVHKGMQGADDAIGDLDAAPAAANAQDTHVLIAGGGSTTWVAANYRAYNQVLVGLFVTAVGGGTVATRPTDEKPNYGVSVSNTSSGKSLQVKRQEMFDHDDNSDTELVPKFRDNYGREGRLEDLLTLAGGNGVSAIPNPGLDADSGNAKTALLMISRVLETPSESLHIDNSQSDLSGRIFFVVGSKEADPIGSFGDASFTYTVTGADGETAASTIPVDGEATALNTSRYFIVASNNDNISVTARGSNGARDYAVSSTLKVDTQAPTIANITPTPGTNQSSTSAIFGATFTDSGSGLLTDAERPAYDQNGEGQTDGDVVDGDNDQIRANEPLTTARTAAATPTDGSSRDIRIHVSRHDAPNESALTDPFDLNVTTADTDVSEGASRAWRTVANGFSVSFTHGPLSTSNAGGVAYYAFLARDRVGNIAYSGANTATGANKRNNHVLIIDRTNPELASAAAGKGYSSSTPLKGTADLKSIEVTFKGGIEDGGAIETLDASTVDASDFSVDLGSERLEVVEATVREVPRTPEEGETRKRNNVVYLTLAEDLPPSAKPKVAVIGSISDLAGNLIGAGSAAVEASDETKPIFTVTVTGGVADPVVAAKGTEDGKITVRVVANEALNRAPELDVIMLTKDEADTGVVVPDENHITAEPTLAAVSGEPNTWEAAFELEDDGLYTVYVSGSDKASPVNKGETMPLAAGDDVTPDVNEGKFTLFEIDNGLAAPEFVLTPKIVNDGKKTQSGSPFIRINFDDEGEEYVRDSHKGVTLTKLVLRDSNATETDLLGMQGTVDPNSFLVSLSGLDLGKYTLLVNGEDALGNARAKDVSFDFEVVQRPAQTVPLWPGRNLVSLPGDPEDPSIGAVLGTDHPATAVLSYEPTNPAGPWLSATREAGGEWSGPLTEIRQGKGYWVDTTTFTPLSAQIRERAGGEVPPTFPLVSGWNLIGVVAASLDSITGRGIPAKDYLASINWSVAYTYNTSANAWTKITDTTTETVDGESQPSHLKVGQGVWVWVEGADVLAP